MYKRIFRGEKSALESVVSRRCLVNPPEGLRVIFNWFGPEECGGRGWRARTFWWGRWAALRNPGSSDKALLLGSCSVIHVGTEISNSNTLHRQ